MLLNSEIKKTFVETFGRKVEVEDGCIKSDLWNVKYSELEVGEIYAEISLNIILNGFRNHKIFKGRISNVNLDVKEAFINNFKYITKLNDFEKETEEEKNKFWEEFSREMEVFSLREMAIYKNHFSPDANNSRWTIIKGEEFLMYNKTHLSEGEIYFYNELPILAKKIKIKEKKKQMERMYA